MSQEYEVECKLCAEDNVISIRLYATCHIHTEQRTHTTGNDWAIDDGSERNTSQGVNKMVFATNWQTGLSFLDNTGVFGMFRFFILRTHC